MGNNNISLGRLLLTFGTVGYVGICTPVLAQSVYSPSPNGYTVNGHTVTGSGSNPTAAYFLDPSATEYHITIGSGSDLGNTTALGNSNELDFGTGSVLNKGTLEATDTSINFLAAGNVTNLGTIVGDDYGIVLGGDSKIVNSGTITGNANAVIHEEIDPVGGPSTVYRLNVTNSGSLLSSNGDGIELYNETNGGTGGGTQGESLVLNNTGTINVFDEAVSLDTGGENGSGNTKNTLVLNNSGLMTSTNSDAIDVDEFYAEGDAGNGTGVVNILNTGTISGVTQGIYLDLDNESEGGNGNNVATVINRGTISATGNSGTGLDLGDLENYENAGNGTNTIHLVNSGSITADYAAVNIYSYNEENGGIGLNKLIFSNSGTLTSTDSYAVDAELYNEANTGNGTIQATIVNSGNVTASEEGIYLEAYNEDDDGNGKTIQKVTNSGTVTGTGTNSYGIDVYEGGNYDEGGTATSIVSVGNSGTVTARYLPIYIYTGNEGNTGNGLSTIDFANSGIVTGTGVNSYAVYIENYNEDSVANATTRLGFLNSASGNITSLGETVSVLAPNYNNAGTGLNSSKVDFANEGIIQSTTSYAVILTAGNDISGGNANSSIVIGNSGLITGDSEGLSATVGNQDAAGNSSSSLLLVNTGTIVDNSDTAVDLENNDSGNEGTGKGQITVFNSSTGLILGSAIGLYISNTETGPTYDAKVTNDGVIAGGTDGIDLETNYGTVIANGGVISGGTDSILLDGSNSTVTVQGRSELNGVIEGSGLANNTLDFNLMGLTHAQIAAAKLAIATAGGGAGSFTAAGYTYSFDGFSAVNFTGRSFADSVDSGLSDLAGKIDAHPLSGDFDQVYVQGASNPETTLSSLSGRQFLNAFQQIGLNNATEITSLVDDRSFQLRSGTAGLDLSGLQVNPSSMIAALGNTSNVLNRLGANLGGGTTMSDSKNEETAPSTNSPRWGAWASGTVTFSDESSANQINYHGTNGSPTVGVDYRLTNGLVVGALFNYTRGDVDFADGSNLETDTELGALYANWTDGHWFVDGLAGYGHTDYDQERTTLGGETATASPDGDEVLATLGGGYDFKVQGWTVSPELGLQYTHLTKEGFAEAGGGAFDLNVGDQDIDSLRTKLGFHATKSFRLGCVKLIPQINATYYHELLDDTDNVSNSLPDAPALGSFVVGTDPQGRDFALVGAGLTAVPGEWHDHVSLFLNYDAQVGQNDFIAHTVDGGVRVNF